MRSRRTMSPRRAKPNRARRPGQLPLNALDSAHILPWVGACVSAKCRTTAASATALLVSRDGQLGGRRVDPSRHGGQFWRERPARPCLARAGVAGHPLHQHVLLVRCHGAWCRRGVACQSGGRALGTGATDDHLPPRRRRAEMAGNPSRVPGCRRGLRPSPKPPPLCPCVINTAMALARGVARGQCGHAALRADVRRH